MITYTAAGLPVIVDGPEDSAAWQLVKTYGAGVLCDRDRDKSLRDLRALFSDTQVHTAMSEGSRRMCGAEFDLETNAGKLQELLRKSVESFKER